MNQFMFELSKERSNGKGLTDIFKAIKRFVANFNLLRERKDDKTVNMNNVINESTVNTLFVRKWYEGKSLEELPGYLFWPGENRYGKVLWWGHGKDGLYFIEKGRGYIYSGINEVFLPASESEYNQFVNTTVELQ